MAIMHRNVFPALNWHFAEWNVAATKSVLEGMLKEYDGGDHYSYQELIVRLGFIPEDQISAFRAGVVDIPPALAAVVKTAIREALMDEAGPKPMIFERAFGDNNRITVEQTAIGYKLIYQTTSK